MATWDDHQATYSQYRASGREEVSPDDLQLERDAEELIEMFIPHVSVSAPSRELPLPFCLPQILTGLAPFTRGYNDELASTAGISQQQLLDFVDGLNLAIIGSPPLRVVDMAGMVIGLVPHHWAFITSTAMQAAAQTAIRVLSKSLTDRYLRAANERLFKPRGLSVRLCTTKAAFHLLSSTSSQPTTGATDKLNSFGRSVGRVLLKVPLPVTSRVVHTLSDKPPNVSVSDSDDPTEAVTRRRLQLTEGQALPVSLDVPPPRKPQGAGETIQDLGVKLDKWKQGRSAKRADKKRLALEDERNGASSSGPLRGLLGNVSERRKARGPGIVGSLIGPKESLAERRVSNANLAEHWDTNDLLWIVIMNSKNGASVF